ncbi:hypothetical protein TRICI_002826 [Trichomonascus ciferrii]|uniref:DNA damage checkpoint protein LCD1 n=1 Tax=Trichomonascus ciferrii TaxID=44093 RepID=A0A642V5R1_9ASCO|nr:hypothetical protein TRICI_002826 [Trichomonascus ciferrii]
MESSSDDDDELIKFVQERELKKGGGGLEKELQQKEGEISILRSNLAQSQRTHETEVGELRQLHYETKKKADMELETLRAEIQRLKNEKDFLVNEVHQSAIQRKVKTTTTSTSNASANSTSYGTGNTTVVGEGETPSPKGSPRKKRDFASSFREGFDNNLLLSPSKRQKKQQLAHKMVESTKREGSPSVAEKPIAAATCTGRRADEAVVSSLYRNSYVLDFVQTISNYDLYENGRVVNIIEELDRFKDRESGLPMAVVLQRIINESLTPDVVLTLFDVCLRFLWQCVNEKRYEPMHYLFTLLYATLVFDPKTILQTKLEPCFQFLKHVIIDGLTLILQASEEPLPRVNFQNRVLLNRHHAFWFLITGYSMDILETICFCAGFNTELFRKCWTLIDTKFIITLLCPQIPANLLIRSVLILTSSISTTSVGHIETRPQGFRTADETEEFVTDPELVDYCKRLLNEPPVVSNALLVHTFNEYVPFNANYINGTNLEQYSVFGYDLGRFGDNAKYLYELNELNDTNYIVLQRAVIKFLTTMLIRRGINPLIDEDSLSLIFELVTCLCDQFEIVYTREHHTGIRLKLINDCVRLLHAIWFLHPELPKILKTFPPDKERAVVVALARVAFSSPRNNNNDPAIDDAEIRFPEDVIDKARDILEQALTPDEANDIYDAMSNPE